MKARTTLVAAMLLCTGCPPVPHELDPFIGTGIVYDRDGAYANCGNLGQQCCDDGTCHQGGVCVVHMPVNSPAQSYTGDYSTCVTASNCGGPEQPCCPDGSCRVDTVNTEAMGAIPVYYRCASATHLCEPWR